MTNPDDSDNHATRGGSGDASNSQGLLRGSNLGRYVIIEPIGSGGMGTVYRAYDPQLNRGVALKILSVKHADLGADEKAKTRLIREAQALAQLSHPNVVTVHDVGTFEDDVFIAMELVEGKTLNDWLKDERRTVEEILEVMIAAGRGLSAAHKAGLVHRDFKPGNVILGDDGRVRVLDFGLARAADQQQSNEDVEHDELIQETKNPVEWNEISSDSSPSLLESPLTHAGGVLGTPMYMAPEQHLGLKTDERTDQFGFCVVLYEALYGKRPFIATTLEKLRREVVRQQVRTPMTDTDVPAWLWKILRKGLSAKSEDRYATIDLLLEDFDKDPQEVRRQKRLARKRRLFLITLVMLTIALPIGVWYGFRYRTVQLCKETEDELVAIWDEATKASIRKAFLGIKKNFALGTWERVERTFDTYLVEWMQMRSEVCEARLLHATQSEELFDLRMSCLRKRLLDIEALVGIFVKADTQVVQKAVQASSSLSGIAVCANEESLRAPYPPPRTIQAKASVAAIRAKLSEVEAFIRTGKYKDGLELAKNLSEEANTIAYRPVQAEVLYWIGYLLNKTGEYKKAEMTLFDAARLAGESRDTLLASKAMEELVFVLGYQQDRHEAGLMLGRSAEIMLSAAGGDDTLKSLLFQKIGAVFLRKANHPEALRYLRKALVIQMNTMGPKHPEVAWTLNTIGLVYLAKEEYEKALEHYHKALSIKKNRLGAEHPEVAPSLNNLGLVYQAMGENVKALKYLRKSLSIAKLSLGTDHPKLAWPLHNIGNVYSDMGELEQALGYYRKALATREKTLEPEHPKIGDTLYSIGFVFSRQGHHDQALAYYHKALAIMEKAYGPDHPLVAWPLTGIGDVFLTQGLPKQARNPLERAVNLCGKNDCESLQHGQSLFVLARALFEMEEDKQRAIKLAKQAREVFSKTPKRFKKEIKEVNTWLQKHVVAKLAQKTHK